MEVSKGVYVLTSIVCDELSEPQAFLTYESVHEQMIVEFNEEIKQITEDDLDKLNTETNEYSACIVWKHGAADWFIDFCEIK